MASNSSLTNVDGYSEGHVTLNLHFDDRIVDVIAGGFDLAIRISRQLKDSTLIGQRLISTGKVFVAARSNLDEWGTPTGLKDLKYHQCMDFGPIQNEKKKWTLNRPNGSSAVSFNVPIAANNLQALILAAQFGCGIIRVPEICVSGEITSGRLHLIEMDDYSVEPWGVFAVYPQRNTSPTFQTLLTVILLIFALVTPLSVARTSRIFE